MRLRVAVLCLCACSAASIWAGGKFPPVSVRCKDAGFKLQVDADGLTDVCVASAQPVCPKGQRLHVDFDRDEDACVPESGAAEAKPTRPACPPKLDLKRKKGEDACEATKAAHCPSGYLLRLMQGEDICMP